MRQFSGLKVLLSSLAVGFCAAAANAGSVTYNYAIEDLQTDWNQSLLLPKFNSALGELTRVTLSVDTNVSSTITVTNNHLTDKASTISVNTQTEVLTTLPNSLGSFSFSANSTNGTISELAAQAQTTFEALSGSNSSGGRSYTASNILASFTGSGSVSLPITTHTQTYMSFSGGNIGTSQVTTADAYATVTYDFIPEPVMLGSMAVGFAGLAMRRRTA